MASWELEGKLKECVYNGSNSNELLECFRDWIKLIPNRMKIPSCRKLVIP